MFLSPPRFERLTPSVMAMCWAQPKYVISGASTRQAAEAFQAREGLSIDGVIGRATWDKLVLAFNAAL